MEKEVQKSKRSSLGKGLGSLLGDVSGQSKASRDKPQPKERNNVAKVEPGELSAFEIEIEKIKANPLQPRKAFSSQEMQDLARSIEKDGVLQPVIVVPRNEPGGGYTLVAGERRLRASKIAGKKSIPALIKNIPGDQMLRLALVENIQRSDLNIVEEALAYESLITEHGLSQDECALQVGKDRSTISNAIRILGLPASVKSDLINEKLTMGHARALAGLKNKDEIERVRELIHKRSLSVRQTETLCKNVKSGKAESKNPELQADPDMEYLADRLRSHLRTKVKLAGNPNRGKIEISYFSSSELERILDSMGYDA